MWSDQFRSGRTGYPGPVVGGLHWLPDPQLLLAIGTTYYTTGLGLGCPQRKIRIFRPEIFRKIEHRFVRCVFTEGYVIRGMAEDPWLRSPAETSRNLIYSLESIALNISSSFSGKQTSLLWCS